MNSLYKTFGEHAFPALSGSLGPFADIGWSVFFGEFLVHHTSHGGFLKLHFFFSLWRGHGIFNSLSLQRNAVRFSLFGCLSKSLNLKRKTIWSFDLPHHWDVCLIYLWYRGLDYALFSFLFFLFWVMDQLFFSWLSEYCVQFLFKSSLHGCGQEPNTVLTVNFKLPSEVLKWIACFLFTENAHVRNSKSSKWGGNPVCMWKCAQWT